jgi:hypothetical protein
VITDPAILSGGNFSLARTLNAIIQSKSGADLPASEAERIALLQTLIETFEITEAENPKSHVRLRVDARPGERALVPAKLLNSADADGMRPVALFNRFDLMPENRDYCGEHRIVYAKGDPVEQLNRFFLIFEAALLNPVQDADVTKRVAACRSIARFWDSLKDKSGADLIGALEKFYYEGLDADEDGRPDFLRSFIKTISDSRSARCAETFLSPRP